METNMDMNKIEQLSKLLEDYDPTLLNYTDYIELNSVNSFEDLCKLLKENNAFKSNITDYVKAMEYLAEQDLSLRNCIYICANILKESDNIRNFIILVKSKYDELFPSK